MTSLISGAVCFIAGWCMLGVILLGRFQHMRDNYDDPYVCDSEDDTLRKWMCWQAAVDVVRKFLP